MSTYSFRDIHDTVDIFKNSLRVFLIHDMSSDKFVKYFNAIKLYKFSDYIIN